jgi:hypothetical protein
MSGFGAQMGSVFMSMKQRNRMGGFIPEHEKVIIARRPIMPAPPARIFNPKHISSYLTAPEKRSIYMEQIQLQDAIRKLQEPLRPSLELEKAVKRLEFNKLAELDARIRDQLSKGLITPDQYMERTQAYRNEFDTAVRRADIADLQSRLASVGLPAPDAGLPQTPVIAPRDFAVSNILNPEGDLTRPIRISETPLISMPASLQGNRPASETQRPQIVSRDDPRTMLDEYFASIASIIEEGANLAGEERINQEFNLTGGRPELSVGNTTVSGMVPIPSREPSGISVARPRGSGSGLRTRPRTEEELQRRAIADALEMEMGDWRRDIKRNPELARKTIREVEQFETERITEQVRGRRRRV